MRARKVGFKVSNAACGRHAVLGIAAFAAWIIQVPQSVAAWQAVEIEAAASSDEIFVGESIDYQIEIRNSKNPSAPDMAPVKDLFTVIESGNHSRNQSSTMIINGRVSQTNTFSHVYQYRLTPNRAGSIEIPGVTANIDGKPLVSNALRLRVVEPEPQSFVLIEIEEDKPRIYPTQAFSVRLRVLVRAIPGETDVNPLRPLRRRPPHIEINWAEVPDGLTTDAKTKWLEPLLARDRVGFTLNDVSASTGSFFDSAQPAVFDFFRSRETRVDADGNEQEYFAFELTREFTADRAGQYRFGPAVVKGTFITGIQGTEYTAKRLVAVAEAKTIEVRDVPTPRPATFCGGIGDIRWRATAGPTTLRVGDPLTLTLEAERGPDSGSLDLVAAPAVGQSADVAAKFELIDQNPTGRVEGDLKRFVYSMRPKSSDVDTIPSLTISMFDPVREEFIEAHTDPIPLEVREGVRVTGGDLIGRSAASAMSEIKSRDKGIFQNITDPSLVRDERVPWTRLGQLVGSVWIVTGTVIFLLNMRRHRAADPALRRRAQAPRVARQRMRDAQASAEQGKATEAMRQVRAAFLGIVADTRGGISESLTTSDVLDALKEARVDVETQTEVRSLLQDIESAEYGASRKADAADAIAKASTLIDRLVGRLG